MRIIAAPEEDGIGDGSRSLLLSCVVAALPGVPPQQAEHEKCAGLRGGRRGIRGRFPRPGGAPRVGFPPGAGRPCSIGRNLDLGEGAGRSCGHRRGNLRKPVLDEPPSALAKNDDCDGSIGQVLLVPEIPVGGKEHLESGRAGLLDRVTLQDTRHASRRAVVEEDAHQRPGTGASGLCQQESGERSSEEIHPTANRADPDRSTDRARVSGGHPR